MAAERARRSDADVECYLAAQNEVVLQDDDAIINRATGERRLEQAIKSAAVTTAPAGSGIACTW